LYYVLPKEERRSKEQYDIKMMVYKGNSVVTYLD
jgi:hypothetical protein